MELLIKLYKDKPSRIGVKYPYQYLAVQTYEELVRKYRRESLQMKIELPKRSTRLNLHLYGNHSGTKVTYKELEYRSELFGKLNALMKPDMPTEFVHIYTEANIPLVAKPFKKQAFFAISSVEILTADNYTDVM